MIIPINNGYYQYKSINGFSFKSRIEELTYTGIKPKCDILEFENTNYIIGMGKRCLDIDKTESEFTKICVINMLARFVKPNKQESFKVLLTSPPVVYARQKKELPEYLKGTYEIIHNNTPKQIIIEDVRVLPETCLIYLSNNPEQYAEKQLLVLDIGGYTSNVIRVIGGNFTDKEFITIQKGMYHIDTEIAKLINSKHYMNCKEEDIFYYRKNGCFNRASSEDIMEVEKENIKNIYRSHVEDILSEIQIQEWNIKGYEVLVGGGGGLILYDTIREYMPHATLSDDPVFDNLHGLELLAKEVF